MWCESWGGRGCGWCCGARIATRVQRTSGRLTLHDFGACFRPICLELPFRSTLSPIGAAWNRHDLVTLCQSAQLSLGHVGVVDAAFRQLPRDVAAKIGVNLAETREHMRGVESVALPNMVRRCSCPRFSLYGNSSKQQPIVRPPANKLAHCCKQCRSLIHHFGRDSLLATHAGGPHRIAERVWSDS